MAEEEGSSLSTSLEKREKLKRIGTYEESAGG